MGKVVKTHKDNILKLGIDVGTGSLGYALLEFSKEGYFVKCHTVGSKILNIADANKFELGDAKYATPNAIRGENRSSRNLNKTWKKRRNNIKRILKENFDCDVEYSVDINDVALIAYNDKISLPLLSHLIINFAKYRGYSESDDMFDVKKTEKDLGEYKTKIATFDRSCRKEGLTYREYMLKHNIPFHQDKTISPTINQQLYIEELDLILGKQKEFYPEIITDRFITFIKKNIYKRKEAQSVRPMKNNCVFEGVKVTPRANPVFQDFRLWETIHNLRLRFKIDQNISIDLPKDLKILLFDEMESRLAIKNSEITKMVIDYFKHKFKYTFDGVIKNTSDIYENHFEYDGFVLADPTIDDILEEKLLKKGKLSKKDVIDTVFNTKVFELNNPNLLKGATTKTHLGKYTDMWTKIYSEKTTDKIENSLLKAGLSKKVAKELSNINLETDNCSYSEKAIKKLLPHMNGDEDFLDITEAVEKIYKDNRYENTALRNPIVSHSKNIIKKLCMDLCDQYDIDEVSIEMARNLKVSKKRRESASNNNNQRHRKYERYSIMMNLINPSMSVTYNKKLKLSLWEEQGGEYIFKMCKTEKEGLEYVKQCSIKSIKIDYKGTFTKYDGKLGWAYLTLKKDALEVYEGLPITIIDALDEHITEKEHTLPKSRFYNNTMNNLSLTTVAINGDKDRRTGFEYMSEKHINNPKEIANYKKRLNSIYNKRNNNTHKRAWFMYDGKESMPKGLVSSLNDTSYIAKEIKKELSDFDIYGINPNNIITTSGSVTSMIRNFKKLKFDKVLKNLNNIPHSEKFDKRSDNRHHAIDAIIIALTKVSYIKKINSMNADADDNYAKNISVWNTIENDIFRRFQGEIPFDVVRDIIKNIIVAYEPNKYPVCKYKGSYYLRGQVHEATVYGRSEYLNTYTQKKKKAAILLGLEKKYSTKEKEKKDKAKVRLINNFTNMDLLNRIKNNSKSENDQDIIDSAIDVLKNDPIFKNTKGLVVRSNGDKKNGISKNRYVLGGSNFRLDILSFEDGKNEIECIKLIDLANKKNLQRISNRSDTVMQLHKLDYIVLGYTKEEVEEMISNNDNSFYDKIYYITGIGDETIKIRPHYKPQGNPGKDGQLLISIAKIVKDYGKFCNGYIDDKGKLVIKNTLQ